MTNEIVVRPIKTDNVETATRQATSVLAIVEIAKVVDQASYAEACKLLGSSKKAIKDLNTDRLNITRKLDSAKKDIKDLYDKPIGIWGKVGEFCNKGIIAFDERMEAERKKEQEKLDRQAEAERQRKEAQKREWERKAKEKEELALKLQAEGKAEEARKAREEAEKAAKKAETREEAANGIIPAIAAPGVDKVKGTYFTTKWHGEVFNFEILPDAYKMKDQQKIDGVARATKGTIEIPGVKMVSEKRLVSKQQ